MEMNGSWKAWGNTAAAQWRPRLPLVIFSFCVLLMLRNLLLTAWNVDDAFITFRVVDNFVNGYGLRWNTDERVQVYTHPLWLLILIPFYAVWHNIFLINVLLATALAVSGAVLLARTRPFDARHAVVLVMLPLLCSRTISHHTVNGLEGGLSLFCLGLFWRELLREQHNLYRLALFASLSLLTRLDNLMVMLPSLLWLAWQHRHFRFSIPKMAAATFPIWGWLLFALFYYGFIFPNTKYAKLHTGLTRSEYIRQGLFYVENLTRFDRFGSLYLLFTLLLGLVMLGRWLLLRRNPETRPSQQYTLALCIWLGVVLNVLYVVRVGGDFLAGRFFLVPLFGCAAATYAFFRHVSAIWLMPILGLYLSMHSAHRHYEYLYTNYNAMNGIYDDRTYYLRRGQATVKPEGGLRGMVPAITKVPRRWPPPRDRLVAPVEIKEMIGLRGYVAGPHVIVIDALALGDALLARLPASRIGWKIAHHRRPIPEGYVRARSIGHSGNMALPLRLYYQKLRLVTSGDLFSLDRLKTIIGFQFGRYEKWRNAYVYRTPIAPKDALLLDLNQ